MTKHITSFAKILIGACCLACGVESESGSSGGIDEETPGFAVVNSDYQSVSVSLVGFEGDVLSERFIASGSADSGLSAALGGDVVLPTMPSPGPELVLIDRTPSGVLTWVDRGSAKVRAQLSVATGFAANPHDYVPVSDTKAYVTRFAWNLASGEHEFDEGNDVLVIDPSVPEIVDRIDLMPVLEGEPAGFYPSADHALMAGGQLFVLAVGFNVDFTERLNSRLVRIDPARDRIEDVLVFDGLNSCSSLDLAPDGVTLAIACHGAFGNDPQQGHPDSGIVLVNIDGSPRETARFAADDLGGAMIAGLAFVDERTLLFTSFGRYDDDLERMAVPDTARLLDTEGGGLLGEPLQRSKSVPFTLGDISCVPEIRTCVLCDAESEGGVLHRFRIADGELEERARLRTDGALGLPPRVLGRF
ncbi:MAG TPA: hypothetical protein VI197_26320 [Polyangiaceae bacterium]